MLSMVMSVNNGSIWLSWCGKRYSSSLAACRFKQLVTTAWAGAGVLQGHRGLSPLSAFVGLQVELQGVSLVVLSVFRDAEKARQLADLVQRHGGIMGAAVCCAENGGSPSDEWTTCDGDRDQLLDR